MDACLAQTGNVVPCFSSGMWTNSQSFSSSDSTLMQSLAFLAFLAFASGESSSPSFFAASFCSYPLVSSAPWRIPGLRLSPAQPPSAPENGVAHRCLRIMPQVFNSDLVLSIQLFSIHNTFKSFKFAIFRILMLK